MIRSNLRRRLGAPAVTLLVVLAALVSLPSAVVDARLARPALQATDLCANRELTQNGTITGNINLSPGTYAAASCAINVQTGATLTLQSGVTIEFGENRSLTVLRGGMLNVLGTAAGDVKLISGATQKVAGDWGGLIINDTARVNLRGIEVRHAGRNGTPSIRILADGVALSDVHVAEGLGIGISVAQYGVRIQNAVVESHAKEGILVQPREAETLPVVALTGITLRDNTAAAVQISGPVRLETAGNSAEDNGINGLVLQGMTYKADATLAGGDLPYILTGPINVQQGTLTIQAGALVKFGGTNNVEVRASRGGRIEVLGTEAEPVIMTAIADDSTCPVARVECDTGNDGQTSPLSNAWRSITFSDDSGGGRIERAELRYGGGQAMVNIESEGVVLDHVGLRFGETNGVRVNDVDASIASSTFHGNRGAGVLIDMDHPISVMLQDSTFTENAVAVDAAGADVELDTSGNQVPGFTNGINGYQITGDMTDSHTWRSGDLPFVPRSRLRISESDATLHIQAGTVVKLASAAVIEATRGAIAVGTEDGDAVLITSLADDACSATSDAGCDTNGDSSDSRPLSGDWDRIEFDTNSTGGAMVNAVVRYGGTKNSRDEQIRIERSQVALKDLDIAFGAGPGLLIATASPTLSDLMIHDNAAEGIVVTSGETPLTIELTGTSIYDNGQGGNDVVGALHVNANVELVIDDTNSAWRDTGAQINGIVIDGQASVNRRWRATSLPFVILGTVDVVDSATLTIEPGAIVRFGEGAQLTTSRGYLDSAGTAEAPILFTAISDDDRSERRQRTDPGAGSPSAGSWGGLLINQTTCGSERSFCGRLEHVIVRYTGRRGVPAILIRQPRTLVRFSEVAFAAAVGIEIDDADSVELTDNTIRNATGHGINVATDSSLAVIARRNTIDRTDAAIAIAANVQLNMASEASERNVATNSRVNGVLVNGDVRSVRTWQADDLVWVVEKLVRISDGTLRIAPGAVVKGSLTSQLLLSRGSLEVGAQETARDVLLTSIRDDRCAVDDEGAGCDTDGTNIEPAPGDWQGIVVERGTTGSTVTIDHAEIRFGGTRTRASVSSMMARTTVRSSRILQSLTDGLELNGVGSLGLPAVVQGNTLADNVVNGLLMREQSHVRLVGNVFTGNERSLVHRSTGEVMTVGNVAIGNVRDPMLYCAPVERTQAWSNDLARELDCTVEVRQSSDLTIEPGTLVRFGKDDALNVRANSLRAEGVVFIVAEGEASGATWRGIEFQPNTGGYLRHNLLAFGGSTSGGAVSIASDGGPGGAIVVAFNTFLRSLGSAISVDEDVAVEIIGNTIRTVGGSTGAGVRLRDRREARVENNHFDDMELGIDVREKLGTMSLNNFAGVRKLGITQDTRGNCVDGRFNWWGDAFGPNDTSGASDSCSDTVKTNPDHRNGIGVSDGVLYRPWLTQAPPRIPLVELPRSGHTSVASQRLIGRGEPGSSIRVYDRAGTATDETVVTTAPVGADGRFDISLALQPGAHHLSVEAFAPYATGVAGAPTELKSPRTGYRYLTVDASSAIDPASIVFEYGPPGSLRRQPLRDLSGAATACGASSSGRVVIPPGQPVVVQATAAGAAALEFVQAGVPAVALSAAGGVHRSQPFTPEQGRFTLRAPGGGAFCEGFVFIGGTGRVFFDDGVDTPPILSEGFETGVGTWSLQAPWARVSDEKHSGDWSLHSNPGAKYPVATELSISLSEPVDLRDTVAPRLNFWQRFRFASGDVARVQYKLAFEDDWKDFELGLPGNRITGVQTTWTPRTVSLEPLARQPRVYIRFLLVSNRDANVDDGWWLDDITIGSGGALNGRYDEGEELIAGATVELLQRDPDPRVDPATGRTAVWVPWNATATNQSNPQITDAAGRFGFFSLPPGEYMVMVTTGQGLAPYASEPYIVTDGTLAVDVPLVTGRGVYFPVVANRSRIGR